MTRATIQYPFPLHQIQVHPEISIAYMDEGEGATTFLFIHGLANYAPVWQYQISELKNNNRCIAIDLPGNGYSSRGDYPYTMFFYAESVARFIETLDLKNVVLVGHSMGGQVSMVLALRYPLLIQKLILIGSAGLEYFATHEVMMMQGALKMGTLFASDEFHLKQAIEQSFFSSHNDSAKIIEQLHEFMKLHPTKQWREMSIKSINGMLNEQVQQFLPEIQVPTHIIFGKQDALIPNSLVHFGETPTSIAQKAAALIPNATFTIINNAGHFVQIEKPIEVNGILASFVNDAKVIA
ncbi:MAG: alpha/beta hydrolase [Bacteroidia bacterium]|jgi:pimeloyl-ACP methyl ester carboxylesterase|nr:alpha/beta hydrolase [Bacteroidia bacterium]